jgi:hypothetical protein
MAKTRLYTTMLLACLATVPALAWAAAAEPAPARVMVMGVFHFGNPGLDMVKSDVIDVMSADNQAWLHGLAQRLAAFQPTDVLVECDPSDQAKIDTALAAYRQGAGALKSNEIYQIGFRLAKVAAAERFTCFDQQQVQWEGGPMFEYLKANQPMDMAAMEAVFAALSARTTQEQSRLSLQQLLQLTNDAQRDRENKDLYIRTNAVDAGGRFIGADASASGWRRNFHMYANVQKAAQPGRRVFVLAGAGNAAILKDLLAIDSQRQAEDVAPCLLD